MSIIEKVNLMTVLKCTETNRYRTSDFRLKCLKIKYSRFFKII